MNTKLIIWLASASIVGCVIDKYIELSLLNEPENRLDSEGVLMVVEKIINVYYENK